MGWESGRVRGIVVAVCWNWVEVELLHRPMIDPGLCVLHLDHRHDLLVTWCAGRRKVLSEVVAPRGLLAAMRKSRNGSWNNVCRMLKSRGRISSKVGALCSPPSTIRCNDQDGRSGEYVVSVFTREPCLVLRSPSNTICTPRHA